MPPKIVLTNEMIAFSKEITKQLREKRLNLKSNLPKIFNHQFGINISYTKLSQYSDSNCIISEQIVSRVSELSK